MRIERVAFEQDYDLGFFVIVFDELGYLEEGVVLSEVARPGWHVKNYVSFVMNESFIGPKVAVYS